MCPLHQREAQGSYQYHNHPDFPWLSTLAAIGEIKVILSLFCIILLILEKPGLARHVKKITNHLKTKTTMNENILVND